MLEADSRAQVLRGSLRRSDLAPTDFKQSPTGGKFLGLDQARRHKVIALRADAGLWLLPEALGAVGEKIPARHLAFYEDGMAGLFPSNRIWHFAADAGLL
jgi:hypothetical protein